MVYAEVKDSVCVDIVEADETFGRLMGLIELPDGFGIGDFYDGVNWRSKANISPLKMAKEIEISTACHEIIIAGIDVTLSDGTENRFSLEETDQINLATAYNAIQQGATGYPYHADGQLCRIYPATDIITINKAATAHKLHHTTYCNHMMAWARRAETVEELESIVYGTELPEDLAANMAEILANVITV